MFGKELLFSIVIGGSVLLLSVILLLGISLSNIPNFSKVSKSSSISIILYISSKEVIPSKTL